MSRLSLLWRRPEHPTPWALRFGAFGAGFGLWVALQLLFAVGPLLVVVLPVVTVVAAELWYQPARAASGARRREAARAAATPATTPYGALDEPEPQPVAVVVFVVPFVIGQLTLALYYATDEDPLVLIAYIALLVGMLGAAIIWHRRRDRRPCRPAA